MKNKFRRDQGIPRTHTKGLYFQVAQVDDYELRIRLCTTVHTPNMLRITIVILRTVYGRSRLYTIHY